MSDRPPAKLLVVDDEVALTTALCNTLRDEGYETTGFTSGQAAMEALGDADFDLLLTDLMMPEMDGITLLQAALKLDPNLVGILMTAHATVPTAVEAMKTGALDYILKPFKLAEILPVINRALEVRRLRNENIQLREALSIYQSSMAAAFTLDFDTVLHNIADAAVQQYEAAQVSILLPTADGKELYVAVTRGEGQDKLLGKRLPMDESLTHWISRSWIAAAEHRDEIDPRPALDHPWRGLWPGISLPMLAGGALVGVLIFGTLERRHPVTPGQIRALKILVGIASSALQAALLFTAVKSAEQRYRAAFEQAAVGMAEVGLDGRWLRVNQKFCEMLGYSQPEFLERTFQEMTHPDDLERCLACVQRLLNAERQSLAEEKRYLCKNGSPLWVNISLSVVRDGAGAPSYFVAAMEDISERKRAQEDLKKLNAELEQRVSERTTSLEAANRELEAFSYSVSHDLRAPLRAIDGFSQILLREQAPGLTADGRRKLELVIQNAKRMGELIDGLLRLAQLSRQPLRKEPVALTPLVHQVLAELRHGQENRAVEIKVGHLPECEADPSLLHQVLINLLSNAFKFTRGRKPAVIEVGCRSQFGDRVYFVKDNGAGFNMTHADKLFGVFARLHSADQFEGTGVGLSIVYRIIARHGGHIWAESEEGKGATFYFTLA